ncbi:GNAT family N-acyltransferase [Sporomusa malonica]|uniref:Acetyltransferase (GNAT) domain-containing protein n=1 Tax=Sporomusa malonica TaxID=112901 RepID=A0A1W1Y8V4_9FIRM|nr:GNAT family N-acyltransferase [Sporomusa malonica]SMC32261.1 Acetyltransferase (GNAT) domain-containing protein [Sporomusa malonica]
MINNYQKAMSCAAESSENSIEIGIAITPSEKREVYHLRYQIYIEEMSKQLGNTDYVNKLLYDELDEWTVLLYAKIGSELIGTARINIGTLAQFPQEIVDFLSLDTFQDFYTEHSDHKFAYTGKLMIAPAYRSSSALYLLMVKGYEVFCSNQIQFAFGSSNFHLLRLYEQMGFRRYSKNFVESGYGLLTPFILVVNDIDHFRTVRSPFFRIARKRGAVNMQAVEWFHANFTKNSPVINSQIVTEEELWTVLCKRLASPPTEAIAILHKLSVSEAKKFIHCCGAYVQCDSGDIITNQSDVSYSYNILISGRLKSLTFHRPVKEYTIPGQHFGANGLTELTKHTEDIAAMDSVEILVLSGLAFQRFFHSHPEIAHKIVQSMISLTRSKPLRIK